MLGSLVALEVSFGAETLQMGTAGNWARVGSVMFIYMCS